MILTITIIAAAIVGLTIGSLITVLVLCLWIGHRIAQPDQGHKS